jgi:hypothetical protein
VQLTSADGASVEIRPTQYQFPTASGEPDDWDANWLQIRGRVRTVAGETWEFDDPCLTTWEARTLGFWLGAAAEGLVPVSEPPDETFEGLLFFTEPNLGFSVLALGDEELVLRVHLSLECVAGRPGAADDAPYELYEYSVPLRVRREGLLAAARAWEEDLGPFPAR